MRLRRLPHDAEASLVEHLDELRTRLAVSALCVAAAFAIAFWRHADLLRLLGDPLPNRIAARPAVFSVGEPFAIAVKVSFWAAVAVAIPVLAWQVYAYLAPAFSPHHARAALPLLVLMPALFAAGVAFSYLVVLPPALHFLLGFDSNRYTVLPRAQDLYGFELTMLLVTGLLFQLPALALGLARAGVLTARMLRRHRRTAIFANGVVAASMPGYDLLTTFLQFLPLVVLYEASIVLVAIVERRRRRAAASAVPSV